jgi:hypothetical protein
MTTHIGKRDVKRLFRIRDIVSEAMIGQLIESETLFYTLVDEVGLKPDEAEALSLKMFSGGYSIDAKELASIAQENGIQFGLSSRQMPFFVKRFVKSTRIQTLDTNPIQWRMNGFKTFEPPYICGYERASIKSLSEERQHVLTKLDNLNKILATWPENLTTLYLEKTYLNNQLEIIGEKIRNRVAEVNAEK